MSANDTPLAVGDTIEDCSFHFQRIVAERARIARYAEIDALARAYDAREVGE